MFWTFDENGANDAFGGSASTWSTYPAIHDVEMNGNKLLDSVSGGYLWLQNGSGGVSLADPAGAGLDISSSGANLNFTAAGISLHGGAVVIDNAGSSSLSLFGDPSFGIHNGEPAGTGADINLVSQNGGVKLLGSFLNFDDGLYWDDSNKFLGIGTTTPSADLDITSSTHFPLISMTYNGGATGDATTGIRFFNESGLNGVFDATAVNYSAAGAPFAPGQLVFLSVQSGGLLFDSRSAPTVFALNDIEVGRFDVNANQFFVGLNSDDGSGALIQSAGDTSTAVSYWAQGSQGITDSIPNTFTSITVTGGIITAWT